MSILELVLKLAPKLRSEFISGDTFPEILELEKNVGPPS